jgi:hypothetical protein
MWRGLYFKGLILFSTFLLAACGSAVESGAGTVQLDELQNPTAVAPFSFDPLLPFDAIPPVYDPEFLPAKESPYSDEELVIGIAIAGEAKAYSITVLRSREMVNDSLAGIPILVTW